MATNNQWVTIGRFKFNRNDKIGKNRDIFVFKGKYEDEIDVAIKRVLKTDIMLEITLLKSNHIHPNIINYYGTEEDDNFYYIGMELCLDTLESYINKGYNGPQLGITTPEILLQATCGLKYLHQRKVVHRDIKPQNILISRPCDDGGPQIKLTDFAISRLAKNEQLDFTMSGSKTGSEGWIAPEILKNETNRYTNKVDIFPLGCVFSYALSGGKHPYGSITDRYANMVIGKYELPVELNKNASSLITSMLNQDPNNRPSAQEVFEHPFFDDYRPPSATKPIQTLCALFSSPSSELLGRGFFNSEVRVVTIDGQKRACKRIVKRKGEMLTKEIATLKNPALNHTTTIVRYFESVENSNHCYITMERCDSNLGAYIASGSEGINNSSLKQIVVGLDYLHRIGIVHRNIKPSNVLVIFPSDITGNQILLKLADFGTKSTRSIGWMAPEVKHKSMEETGAVDVFAAGCLIYYSSTSGNHPFASPSNRIKTRIKLDLKECQSKIFEMAASNLQVIRQRQTTLERLISWMIDYSPQERPKFHEILSHPFFWSPEDTLEFIRKLSESIDFSGKGTPHQELVIQRIEENKDQVFNDDWKISLTPGVLKQLDIGRRKPYNGNTVHNLLRAIRNKHAHYQTLSQEERTEYGAVPDEYWKYWSTKFPNLIVHLWLANNST